MGSFCDAVARVVEAFSFVGVCARARARFGGLVWCPFGSHLGNGLDFKSGDEAWGIVFGCRVVWDSLLFCSGRKGSKAVEAFCSISRGALQHCFPNLHKEVVHLSPSLSHLVLGSFGSVSMHVVNITPF